jgi:hypothetical protein
MKTIEKTCFILSCFLFAWFALSWFDVVIHNLTPGYEYSNINLLYLITKGIL